MAKQDYEKVPQQQMTSDELHNYNTFRFLQKLRFPISLDESIPVFKLISNDVQKKEYDQTISYGALYSNFMGSLESAVSEGRLNSDEYDDFFLSIFENDNKNLESTYKEIKNIALAKSPSSQSVKKALQGKLKDTTPPINPRTPAYAGSPMGRFFDMITPFYKPSHETSLPTIRSYAYNDSHKSKELRFGTQGQLHYGRSRVSPLFERFLKAKKSQSDSNPITHVYFNNLGRDRSRYSYEGRFESGLTHVLHTLENSHKNIAVITLPADKGLMEHSAIYQRVTPDPDTSMKGKFLNVLTYLNIIKRVSPEPKASLMTKFLDIAMERSTASINDFHISNDIREKIFGTTVAANTKISELLNTSFKQLGFEHRDSLTPAQSQAVWIHFIKYELPKHILEQLNPQTYNFSCKDAIDRGGLSSAYYNLISSLSTNTPMTRDEFETAVHAAPVMVKGRGMNEHLDLLWNVLDTYLNAHPKIHEKTPWLREWRDANCPALCAGHLLNRRLEECLLALKSAQGKTELHTSAEAVLEAIEECDSSNPDNQRLLLDAVVSTFAFAMAPDTMSDEKQKAYQSLARNIGKFAPKPMTCMQMFINVLLSLVGMKVKSGDDKIDSLVQEMENLIHPKKL